MENKNENDTFHYTYSARQQDEVRKIRQKYIPVEENKMERLRRLDQSAQRKGTAVALIFGIIGTLLLGTGMSCIMVKGEVLFIPGIIIGTAGIVLISLAYPMYIRITKKEREKIAPEIIRLTDELLMK